MSVSVVMPNFNNAPYLRQWAEPLIGDPAVGEIVVYDNGSTDGSLELLEQLGSSKLKLIRGASNLGATLGRHEAVMAATGEYICFVDGDDFVGTDAVRLALEALEAADLDISLFQLFEVDVAGANPRRTVPTPGSVIDGRTACSLTLGGWFIHSWGVFRKSLYLQASEGFSNYRFNADELLTRRILLAARRVGPSRGKIFYRRVPKTYDSGKLVDWGRTTVRTLALAVDERLPERPVRDQLRMTTRFMFGLLRRALAGKMARAPVAGLLDEYFAIPKHWNLADAPWLAAHCLLRLGRPLLG